MGRFIFLSSGLLVVFLSLSGTGADQDCLPDWSSHEEHCYKVFKEKKTWEDAEKFCRQLFNGAHLASIESKEEADFVAKLLSQTLTEYEVSVWIGLRDEDKTQQCSQQWTDGSSVTYEAKNAKKCVAVEDSAGYRRWRDRECTFAYPFVCKSWVPH